MKRVLKNDTGSDYGIVGEKTDLKTQSGLDLFVGDIVSCKSTNGNIYEFDAFVCKDKINGYFIMGIVRDCKGGRVRGWNVTLKKCSYEIKAGDTVGDIHIEQIDNTEGDDVMVNNFRIGDKVKVIKDIISLTDITLGDVGEIIEIDIFCKQCYLLKVDRYETKVWATRKEVELIGQANPKFEVITSGTTTIVKCDDGREGIAKLYCGDTYSPNFGIVVALGKLLNVDLVEEVIKVVKSDDEPTGEEIKIFTDSVKLTTKFKVGDIVKMISEYARYGNCGVKVGDIGTIVQVNIEEKDIIIRVKFEAHPSLGLDPKDIKLIEVPKVKSIPIGSKVKIPKTKSRGDYYGLDDLELYEETPSIKKPNLKEETKANPTILKVGDKVRIRKDLEANKMYDKACLCDEDMVKYADKEAKIVSDKYSKDRYELDLDNGNWSWSPSMLEKVETAKIKESIEEVVATEDFNVGDYIYFTKIDDTFGIAKINKIINGREFWGNFTLKNITILPKTIKEFETLKLNKGETFLTRSTESIKKLVLIDDTELSFDVFDTIAEEEVVPKLKVGQTITMDQAIKLINGGYSIAELPKDTQTIPSNSYEIGQELTTMEEVKEVIELGYKVKEADGYIYHQKKGVLKYKDTFGDKNISSGYNYIKLPATIHKLPKTISNN